MVELDLLKVSYLAFCVSWTDFNKAEKQMHQLIVLTVLSGLSRLLRLRHLIVRAIGYALDRDRSDRGWRFHVFSLRHIRDR